MAELLLAGKGWIEPDSLGALLREALSDEYLVVDHPVVYGCPLDALVVGPQGIWVLHDPAASGEGSDANIGRRLQRAAKAVRAFLRDEFPRLQVPLRQLVLREGRPAASAAIQGLEVEWVSRENVGAAIDAAPQPADGVLADIETREALAVAFRDRRLAANQRASRPFVFRSGSLLGSGTTVWTIRDAIRHMDRHPQDGIFHLRNGTLAQWLSEQGAEHLAKLARQVINRRETDVHMALEIFLIGSGLVARPRLQVRPSRLDLGCVLSGEVCSMRFRVQKGPGRGYLFGSLSTSAPWLHVEPRTLTGGPLDAIVTVDTETLPISASPWVGEIEIDSTASAKPVRVPVRVRVVGMPAPLQRYLLRPLAGALVGGAWGIVLGWLLARYGLPAAGWAAQVVPADMLQSAWPVGGALFGVLLGLLRGLGQSVVLPTALALGRWLLRALVWGAALTLVLVAAYWSWVWFEQGLMSALTPPVVQAPALLAFLLALLPATLAELASDGQHRGGQPVGAGRFAALPLRLALIGMGLALIVGAGARMAAPALEGWDASQAAAAARSWLGEGLGKIEATLNQWVDQVYLDTYDQRAPAPPPTPPAEATPRG